MTKVLIIEDEVNLRKILHYDLKHAGYQVDEAIDGVEGFKMAQAITYDLILIDWMLPGMQGIEIVEKLRNLQLKSVIFMITAKDDESDILQAFDLGVDDYITKPFSPRELIARVKVHLRKITSTTKEQSIGNVTINYEKRRVKIEDDELVLTKKEFELLSFLVKNQEKVLSRDEILNEIWGFEYDNDTRIVDVHIFKLRTKLSRSNVNIKSIRGVGYHIEVIDA